MIASLLASNFLAFKIGIDHGKRREFRWFMKALTSMGLLPIWGAWMHDSLKGLEFTADVKESYRKSFDRDTVLCQLYKDKSFTDLTTEEIDRD